MTGELIPVFDQQLAGQPATLTLDPPADWPQPPAADAFHGLAGAIVAKIAPHTESDPIAILTQLRIACGALIGRQAHFQVEATLHHPNEFVVLSRTAPRPGRDPPSITSPDSYPMLIPAFSRG